MNEVMEELSKQEENKVVYSLSDGYNTHKISYGSYLLLTICLTGSKIR